MGTSSSNHGPGDRPPLLPPWAGPAGGDPGGDGGGDDAGGDEDGGDRGGDASGGDEGADEGGAPDGASGAAPEPAAPLGGRPTWQATRRGIGSIASGGVGGGRGRESIRSGVRSAVGAMGGPRRAAQSSPAGRQTTGRLATFFAGVAATGVAGAARMLGIAEFLGRSADVFLLQLGDVLAPAGALTEDAIARDAMDDTLQELYEDLNLANSGVAALDRMTPAMMADALLRYVTNYIYARVIHALTAHIHAKSPTVTRMREIERTARHYIEDAVRLDVDTTAFFGAGGAAFVAEWDGGNSQRVIDRLFEESYRVVEAGLRHGDRGAA